MRDGAQRIGLIKNDTRKLTGLAQSEQRRTSLQLSVLAREVVEQFT